MLDFDGIVTGQRKCAGSTAYGGIRRQFWEKNDRDEILRGCP